MGLSYRSDDEVERWRQRDPINLFEARLADQGVLTAAQAAEVHAEVAADVAAGTKFAIDSPFPDVASLMDDVYYVAPAASARRNG